MTSRGDLLWRPDEARRNEANITSYKRWLADNRGLSVNGYHDLWRWSVSNPDGFWESIWDYFDIQAAEPYQSICPNRAMPGEADFAGAMPGEGWFEGARLNYAEHVFRNQTGDRPALIYRSENGPVKELSWHDLESAVASVASWLRDNGIEAGDRVVGYLPNVPQAVVCFLACASVGAVWSSCSPDFGTTSVVDRFRQVEPSVLFCTDGYAYDGKEFDETQTISELQSALPTVDETIGVPHFHEEFSADQASEITPWKEVVSYPNDGLSFEDVPFRHPLWVLFSSGTTGPPKPIVHGHGGILLELKKTLRFHMDLEDGDRFFWYTSTAWMMWNYLISGLLVGAVPMLYDGSPNYPDLQVLWEFAEETSMNLFGTSADYLMSCREADLEPGDSYDLGALQTVGQTASPLPPEGYEYVYDAIKGDVWLNSASGGTDVCSGFLAGVPTLPVYAGELQARALGCKLHAFNDDGDPVVGEPGELVLTEPLPSMPIAFWGDLNDERYRNSYFKTYPGVWQHGDLMELTDRGTAVVLGRSDATINRKGVRFGTSEIYSVVEDLPEISDSLAVGVELRGGEYYFPLFVAVADGHEFNDELKQTIRTALRSTLSPHHVPDEVLKVDSIPRNLVGKKLEVPVKDLLRGKPLDAVVNIENTENPEAIRTFEQIAKNQDLDIV